MSKKLGDMLIQEGLVSPEQLQHALDEQKQNNGFLGEIMVNNGVIKEDVLVDVLTRQPGVSQISLHDIKIDPTLAEKIPERLARKRGCIPVRLTGEILQVGMVDPLDDRTIDYLHEHSGHTIKVAAVLQKEIEDAWERLYSGIGGVANKKGKEQKASQPATQLPNKDEIEKIVNNSIQEITDAEIASEEQTTSNEAIPLEIGANDPPVIKLSNVILLKCIQTGASDIHVEPQEDRIRIRYRVDGALHEYFSLPHSLKNPLISRFKIMSEMDVAEHRIPQDGRIKLSLGGDEDIDFRVNTLPGVLGEKLVARILGTGMLKGRVAELGFEAENLEHVENALRSHFGMILVTGPTGSGKTTTLYTMLSQVNTEDVNLVTAEDPVEYNLPGIHQVNIRASIGFTFDTALRSFLRQDPDIILVGEMRDYETAAIAVKAALTGHLVLSTLHTNDAPSTVVRLIDMGIEPYLVSSAVKLVIAQRLLRKICSSCKKEIPLSTLESMDLPSEILETIEALSKGEGCEECNGIGNKGRLPLFEVMPIKSKEMRRVITEGGTEVQVAQVARKEGMITLAQNAINMVNEGVINLDEGVSIVMSD